MLSIPPTAKARASPARIAWSARTTALSPEPQTLLIVVAPTCGGMSAPMAAWRAGAWPRPALTTFPINTSSRSSPVDGEDCDLGIVEDRRRHHAAAGAEAGDRERAALARLARQRARAGILGQLLDLARQFQDPLALRVPDHRDDQPIRGVGRNAGVE